MPDPEPCPYKAEDTEQLCLTAEFMDELYDFIDTWVETVNVHRLAADEPEIDNTIESNLRITLDPTHTCITFQDWEDMYQFVEDVITTGRAPKHMYDVAMNTFPEPITESDVDDWEECEGYWETLDEIYACMDLECPDTIDVPSRIDDNQDQCLNKCMMNAWYLVLQCLSDGKCYPDCLCPVCDPGRCNPCRACLTVGFSASTTDRYRLDDMYSYGSSVCYARYRWDNYALLDGTQFASNDTLEINITVTADDMYVKLILYKNDVLEEWRSTVHHIHSNTPDIEPETESCAAWDSASPLELTIPIYRYDNTAEEWQHVEDTEVVIYVGGAPCDHGYHPGVYYEYRVTNLGDLTFPEGCSERLEPDWNGMLTGGGPWQGDGAISGKDVVVYLTFDALECRYDLEVYCGTHGIIWHGFKNGCGGPRGTYTKIEGESGPSQLYVVVN